MNEQNKREKKELCMKEKEIKGKRGNASGQDKIEGGHETVRVQQS